LKLAPVEDQTPSNEQAKESTNEAILGRADDGASV
jgi:hypothetical protein